MPLFIEELTKAVVEAGDDTLAGPPNASLSVPATLQASLIARLDRLVSIAKEVGQIGAVIGREFGYELIERVAQRPAELRGGLDRLVEAELLFCRGVAPQSTYLFKHALVQDAAYGTLLRAKRQELHARVAAVLELHFADLVERQPELLAHHLTAAGNIERAVDQWLKAGLYAAARSAPHEAIGHFDRGLSTLAALPESTARDAREIELHLARGLSFFSVEGFSRPRAASACTRARELAEQRRDPHRQFMAVYGLWQSGASFGRILDCRRLSDRLLQLTAGAADDGLRLQAYYSAWATGLFAGEPVEAREHCEAGRRLYDPERHHSHRLLYGGHDPGARARYIAAQACWMLGYPDQALALGSEAVTFAEDLARAFSLEDALLWDAILRVNRGQAETALQRLVAAETLVAEQRLGFIVEPRFIRGAALSVQGAIKEAVVCLREGLASRLGGFRLRLYGITRLAETLARQGEYGAALKAVIEGRKTLEERGERQWQAELHRVQGIALIGLNRIDDAQAAFEEALRVARRQ